jgi:DNA-directed RNA polymerase III subunit RPC8
MFVIHTVYDIRIQIPPVLMSMPTMQAIHNEIDQTYPNRVLMDVGLVICRYGDCLEIGHGVCVPGDNGLGGAYHPCTFRLVVFRPFVEEVCLGRISKSTSEGIHVSLGFFDNIFVPAYWMLRPSRHEESTGLWVWEPDYSDHEDNEQAGGGGGGSSRNDNSKTAAKGDSSDNAEELKQRAVNVKMEDGAEHDAIGARKDSESGNGTGDPGGAGAGAVENGEQANDDNRFEMEIGSEIRFKVKSIHFAQVTTTAKGMQAFVTSTDKQPRGNSGGVGPVGSNSGGGAHLDTASLSSSMSHPPNDRLVRKRSSSVGLDETQKPPSTMKIMASICEDGLGLTSWWAGEAEEEEEEEEEEQGDDEGGGGGDEGNAGEDHMDEEQEELVVEEEKGMAGEQYKTVMNGI